jgi:hypothetical protein
LKYAFGVDATTPTEITKENFVAGPALPERSVLRHDAFANHVTKICFFVAAQGLPAKMDAESSSASSSTKLQRRLMALPRGHWTLAADKELIAHLSTVRSLPGIAQLSDCLTKMAQHMSRSLQADELDDLLAGLNEASSTLQQLYTVTGSVLQQLAQCLQQYLQQGQLPAALTAYAVEACNALCLALISIHNYCSDRGVAAHACNMAQVWRRRGEYR